MTNVNLPKIINFDLDGTIADLYGVDDWLNDLINGDTRPYDIAKPLVNMSALARVLNGLQKKGYIINIISWTSKNGTAEYIMLTGDQIIKYNRNLEPDIKSIKLTARVSNISNPSKCAPKVSFGYASS